jgi:anti-anti-sigma factor
MNNDCAYHDFSALPLYTFITMTNGVRKIVRQPAITGGAGHQDEAANGLTFTQQYRNGSVVLSVAGDLDPATVSSFRRRLKSAAEVTDNLVLDFRQLRYIDSTGIHALLDVCQTLTLTGRRMALAAIPAQVQRVLTIFGTDGIFPIFSTVDAAVVAFGTAVPRRQ